MKTVAFDVETYLIGPDAIAPKIVCASFHNDLVSTVVAACEEHFLPRVETYLADHHILGQNISYDLVCLGEMFPHLVPAICQAYEEGRVHDTMIREKLADLAHHGDIGVGPTGQQISYSLASIAHRRVGLDLFAGKEGDDIWRLRYHELDGIPAHEYPREAYEYARMDAQATWEVFWHQEQKDKAWLKAEPIHVRAGYCLFVKTVNGLGVDAGEKERIQKETLDQLGPENLPLLYENGIITPPQPPQPYKSGTKEHVPGCPKKTCDCPPKMAKAKPEKLNRKDALIPLIERTCKRNGIPVKVTKKGGVSTDKEFLALLAGYDDTLAQFQTRQGLNKLITSYFPALEWPFGSGVTAKRVHPRYDVLKKTGRVSSRGNNKRNAKTALFPSVAIQLADPRVRAVYAPADGWVYAVADYSALELCSLAQTIYDLYGFSTHRDQINAGIDPHTFLGSVLAFDGSKKFRDEVANFQSDEARVYEHFKQKKEEDPDFYKHWRTFAKPVGLGYPGGMGARTMVSVCAGYGLRVTVPHAKVLKKIWLQVYPELRLYLDNWVTAQDGCYVTRYGGMTRVNCSYTELANGNALQSPGAEGVKVAMWKVVRACVDPSLGDVLYGCKPVINMHDELVLEVPEDERMWERSNRLGQLMVEGMKEVLPDVKVKADPELVRRWTKNAEPLQPQRQAA